MVHKNFQTIFYEKSLLARTKVILHRKKSLVKKDDYYYFSASLQGSRTSVDHGEGTLLDQCCRLHNDIVLVCGQVESSKSQT